MYRIHALGRYFNSVYPLFSKYSYESFGWLTTGSISSFGLFPSACYKAWTIFFDFQNAGRHAGVHHGRRMASCRAAFWKWKHIVQAFQIGAPSLSLILWKILNTSWISFLSRGRNSCLPIKKIWMFIETDKIKFA